ncbi:MAG: hypothetical protein ABIR83_07605 [Nakamurella sp.]
MEEHNRFAGHGSVVLDIGGDVGALIVSMPPTMAGIEIEIRPLGSTHRYSDHLPAQQHDHDHDHGPGHSHHPHVAVIGRPTVNGPAYTAVFPELKEGTYELYEKLGGPIQLQVTVTGGEVQHADWRQLA